MRWELISKHRSRWWRSARLANPNPNPCQQQLPVVLRQSAQYRHARPEGQSNSEQIPPIGSICKACDRDADSHIKESKRHACEERHSAIGEPEFQANGFD